MRTQIHYYAKGHLGQYEDWWYLVQNDGEASYVEHEWDHLSVGSGDKREGSTRLTVEEAIRSAPDAVVKALKERLRMD